MEKQKNIIRLSNLLLDSLDELKKAKSQQIQSMMEDFSIRCSNATKDSHLFRVAVEKGWLIGAENIRSRISRNINDFSYYLQTFKQLINADETSLPKLSDIYAELLQAEQEFGDIKFDLKEKTLSITTEPITLEDIPLGPFEVSLSIGRINNLYSDSPYRIIALEPNPASCNEEVTHPHVSDETLCEGEGHVPIRAALEQGRFCDFFTMIVNLLQTYNPSSPYVSLDDWSGICCYDCGSTVDNESVYSCYSCGNEFCECCTSYCHSCDETICLGCGTECPNCGELVCHKCLIECSECGSRLCRCCAEEGDLCSECRDIAENSEQQTKTNNEKENKNEEQIKCQNNAAVQPDGVGKTTIHA
ncbi:MAG: hypothetical protein WCW64_00840 [Phycisphaerae bacterium]|jgi:hypothetical protein